MYFSELKGKVVIVTGGNKGIGKEIALEFSKLGSSVIILGRDSKSLKATKNLLDKNSHGNLYFQLDINNINKINECIDEIFEIYNRIDILVNNAGINIAKEAFEVTEEDWDSVLDTNLKSLFFISKAVGKKMKMTGGGKIINMASQMSYVGYVKRAAYGSSKGAYYS